MDRFLANLPFLNLHPNFNVLITNRLWSDHNAIIASMDCPKKNPYVFRFCSKWINDDIFCQKVDQLWKASSLSRPYASFSENLDRFRAYAKQYSYSNKVELDVNIKNLENSIAKLDSQLKLNWNEDLFLTLNNYKIDPSNLLDTKISDLKDKARVKWLSDGDMNIKFFHVCIKERTHQAKWNFILDDGSYTSDHEVIGPLAINYFSKLFFY